MPAIWLVPGVPDAAWMIPLVAGSAVRSPGATLAE
jgi:hypothetical protein